MTATQGDLADLSRFVFRAPRWYTSLGFALVLAAVTGVGVFETAYVLGDLGEGVFFVGIPTVVAAFGTTAVDRRYAPRANVAAQYESLYELFVDVREAMGTVWSRRAKTYRELDAGAESGSGSD